MPTPTYTPIWSTTLAASTASVAINGIPQTFKDLVLVWQATTSTTAYTRMSFNSDSGSNYSWVNAYGYSGGAGSGSGSSTSFQLSSSGTSEIQQGNFQLMDYSATDKHKTGLFRDVQDNAGSVSMVATRWASTAAVTTIAITRASGTFAAGSTFALYGIAG